MELSFDDFTSSDFFGEILDEKPLDPHVILWRRVIYTAMLDVFKYRGKRSTISMEAKLWFMKDNRDFVMCCDMADLNPDYIRKFVLNKMEER